MTAVLVQPQATLLFHVVFPALHLICVRMWNLVKQKKRFLKTHEETVVLQSPQSLFTTQAVFGVHVDLSISGNNSGPAPPVSAVCRVGTAPLGH